MESSASQGPCRAGVVNDSRSQNGRESGHDALPPRRGIQVWLRTWVLGLKPMIDARYLLALPNSGTDCIDHHPARDASPISSLGAFTSSLLGEIRDNILYEVGQHMAMGRLGSRLDACLDSHPVMSFKELQIRSMPGLLPSLAP